MDKLGIGTDSNDLGADLIEFFMPLCQGGKLGCSHKGKIRGIKKQCRPLLCRLQGFKAHLTKITL